MQISPPLSNQMSSNQFYLSNIQIVMVNTTLPANIGSAVRAMHTMGLSKLIVVNPKLPIDDSSYSHAAGAAHILDTVKVVESLDEAIANSQLIFAASSRSRNIPRPVVNPATAAKIMCQFIDKLHLDTFYPDGFYKSTDYEDTDYKSTDCEITEPNKNNSAMISILFGREDRGLTNDELATADYHIQIDANPNYPVLNVASAVQVIASFIYSYVNELLSNNNTQAINTQAINNTENSTEHGTDKNDELIHYIRQDWDTPAASHQQIVQLNTRLIELMQKLELANNDNLGLLPQRIQRFSSRIQLDQKELQMINAVVGKLSKLLK